MYRYASIAPIIQRNTGDCFAFSQIAYRNEYTRIPIDSDNDFPPLMEHFSTSWDHLLLVRLSVWSVTSDHECSYESTFHKR